jgi:aldehyde:ferredoxin oxidoreductase
MVVFKYDLKEVDKGYNNRNLHINLTDGKIVSKPVSKEMKEIFTGGRGFCLNLLWNSLPKDRIVRWDDPENAICISCGPLGGVPSFPGCGKSIVLTISPTTDSVMDSNVGGYFGPYIKFAGWDALSIQGKAKSDVVIFINGDEGEVRIEDGEGLPSETHLLGEILTERYGNDKRSISIVSAGPGAENTRIGCLNFSWYDPVRKVIRYKQAGRGGTGTVLRNKKVKAIVAKYSKPITPETNHPADLKGVMDVGRAYNEEIRTLDPVQAQMGVKGSSYLIAIMNQFDLLPVNNFRFGSHPEAEKISGEFFAEERFDKGFDGCWIGCTMACSHCVRDFKLTTGPFKGQKVFVDAAEYETIAGVGSNCGIFNPDYVIEVNFYCDTYGIDTISFGTAVAFVMECYEMGLIDKEASGGLELNFGNKEAALEILHQMARGEGFGYIVGQGIRRMKKIFAEKYGANPKILQDIGMEAKGLEFSEYVTKESLAQQGGYGLALKGPQHDEAWLIFLDMVHNLMPTFEQKAENLHWFPMFRTWFGLNGLCKLPWNDVTPKGNNQLPEPAKFMPHVDWYAKYFSAMTGRKATSNDLVTMSEKMYNFQRIFNLRMGFGTRKYDDIPYRAVGPVTKDEYESRADRYNKQIKEKIGVDPEGKSTKMKIEILRKYRISEYEKLKDAVYKRRGWNSNGIPTLEKVKELGIDFPEVVKLLNKNL